MKFTLTWLREFVDFDLSAVELAERLTMLGLEVDAVVDLHRELAGIKVGRIIEVTPHPDADKLTICRVAVGARSRQVVCGAPNVRAGLAVAVALPGARLPSGLEVGEATIRGALSQGMLCSEMELRISDSHAGVMELPGELEDGLELAEALALRDTMIEVDLTPNRPDCASVLGIAREVAGITGNRLHPPAGADLTAAGDRAAGFTVAVESPSDCPRYAAVRLGKVRIAPSPWWLKKRLLAIGQRSINNVVDVTNLVMMETGQPLHAFDFAKLGGKAIVVRRPAVHETLVTLDGTERPLAPDMLLICDAAKPVALAGVMGGANSEVSDHTTEILLESACFDPVTIRKTARRLNMATEASYRFERGVDADGVLRAMQRAVALMQQVAGAEQIGAVVDVYEGRQERPAIPLRINRTRELLGMDLSGEAIASCLSAIELQVTREGDDLLRVRPPGFRIDLEREIDLVEEVARLQGYNDIPTRVPCVPMSFPEQDEGRRMRRQAAEVLIALGFNEAINYSFTAAENFDRLGLGADHPARRTVCLRNPLSEEQGIMRTMLLPGLLETVRTNVNRQNVDLRIFEIGKVFNPSVASDHLERQPGENQRLCGVLSGLRYPGAPLLHYGTPPADLLDVKGAVTALLDELRLTGFDWLTATEEVAPHRPGFVRPGSCAVLVPAGDSSATGGATLGILGQVEPGILRAFGIKQEVLFFELDLDGLLRCPAMFRRFAALPKFPAVKWDMAVVVPEAVEAGRMVETIYRSNEPLVERAEIFDIYRGKPVEEGYKSVAIAITYRSNQQTLDDQSVEKVHGRLLETIMSRFQGRLREAAEQP